MFLVYRLQFLAVRESLFFFFSFTVCSPPPLELGSDPGCIWAACVWCLCVWVSSAASWTRHTAAAFLHQAPRTTMMMPTTTSPSGSCVCWRCGSAMSWPRQRTRWWAGAGGYVSAVAFPRGWPSRHWRHRRLLWCYWAGRGTCGRVGHPRSGGSRCCWCCLCSGGSGRSGGSEHPDFRIHRPTLETRTRPRRSSRCLWAETKYVRGKKNPKQTTRVLPNKLLLLKRFKQAKENLNYCILLYPLGILMLKFSAKVCIIYGFDWWRRRLGNRSFKMLELSFTCWDVCKREILQFSLKSLQYWELWTFPIAFFFFLNVLHFALNHLKKCVFPSLLTSPPQALKNVLLVHVFFFFKLSRMAKVRI